MQDANISKVHIIVATLASCVLFMITTDSKLNDPNLQFASAIGATFVSVLAGLAAYGICYILKKPYKRISYLAGLILVTLTSIAGQNGITLFGPKNLEQCMIANMKGMPASMTGYVYQECIRQFPHKSD